MGVVSRNGMKLTNGALALIWTILRTLMPSNGRALQHLCVRFFNLIFLSLTHRFGSMSPWVPLGTEYFFIDVPPV